MERGGGRRVGRRREGPLWMASTSIHGVREDLALRVAASQKQREPINTNHKSQQDVENFHKIE